jgi:spoIIIJ-associated protein
MDEAKEFVGSTLEEAKEKARDYFNSNHIEYELMPPKFMTMITGKRDVRIKAKVGEISKEYIGLKQKARELLEEILKESGFELSISESMEDGAIRFVLSGDDTQFFTEDKGRLLDSFQHIVVKSVNKNVEEGINIIVDADDFKKEREEYIRSYVRKACSTVRKTSRPYIMRPLNPAERRQVHILVKAEGDLESESVSEGFYKKIKISKINLKNKKVEILDSREEK